MNCWLYSLGTASRSHPAFCPSLPPAPAPILRQPDWGSCRTSVTPSRCRLRLSAAGCAVDCPHNEQKPCFSATAAAMQRASRLGAACCGLAMLGSASRRRAAALAHCRLCIVARPVGAPLRPSPQTLLLRIPAHRWNVMHCAGFTGEPVPPPPPFTGPPPECEEGTTANSRGGCSPCGEFAQLVCVGASLAPAPAHS